MRYIYKFYDNPDHQYQAIQNDMMKEYSNAGKYAYIKTEENIHLLRRAIRWALIGEKVDRIELHFHADLSEIDKCSKKCTDIIVISS